MKNSKTMKKAIILSFLIFSFFGISAQEVNSDNNPPKNKGEIKTIFGNPETVTAYCAFTGKYGEFYNLPTWDLGMRIGCVVDHWFGMGIAGYGTVQESLYNPILQGDYSLHGGYGGIYFEPILFPTFPAHVSFPVLIGGGGLKYEIYQENSQTAWEGDAIRSNPYWVVEPGAELELNVFKHFRLSFGAHYRITSPIDLEYRENDPINGFSGSISLKFGAF
jgi:hypothetical protein